MPGLEQWLREALTAGRDDVLLERCSGADPSGRVRGGDLGEFVEDVGRHFGPGPVLFAATPGVPARALYIALLAAGITAAPVHASTPPARLRAIGESCGVDRLVVPPAAGDLVPPARFEQVTVAPPTRPRPAGDADHPGRPAYILHTSGSTGRPKGVPIPGRALEAYLSFVIGRFGWAPGARFSATFDLSFDLALHDLLVPVLTGGTSCVVPTTMTLLPRLYAERCGLDQWFSVPGIASLGRRTNSLPAGSLARLSRSLFCGEALARADAAYWAAATGSPVHNLYGPTEMTLAATLHEFRGEPYETVPIGRPFDHLDARAGSSRHPAELLLRGPQMLDGYLDPADDGPAFEVDAAGRRWYRTGDLVEEVAEGFLFHGRLDTQVKLGGHRVDLMDVEHAVRTHPRVQEVVAYVDPGSTRVAVAVVADPAGRGDRDDDLAADVVEHVAGLLPAYMVPARVTRLDELPRNGNGKVDRARTVDVSTGRSYTVHTTL